MGKPELSVRPSATSLPQAILKVVDEDEEVVRVSVGQGRGRRADVEEGVKEEKEREGEIGAAERVVVEGSSVRELSIVAGVGVGAAVKDPFDLSSMVRFWIKNPYI